MNVSPMMRQYEEAKAACGDALLLFRMGDFYELFYEDAKIIAKALGLTLTSRDKGENPIPMAGFPYHQLDGYLAKLIRQGFRVAVCEQVEDPKEAKGIVRREIQRIVTAGTLTDDSLLDPRANNLLASVFTIPGTTTARQEKHTGSKTLMGIACVELSTGRFEAGVYPRARLMDELARLEPSEILLRDDDHVFTRDEADRWSLSRRPAWQFGLEEASRVLKEHFQVMDLSGMGWNDEDSPAICAAGAALAYLQETQRVSLSHIRQLVPIRAGTCLEIDAATRRSLELTHTIRGGEREGSLLEVLDQTVTAMGSRKLADWMASPLVQYDAIQSRLSAVETFVTDSRFRQTIQQALDEVYDLERLLARVATGRTSPRDLKQVGRTLSQLPKIKAQLSSKENSRLVELHATIDLCPELQKHLEQALEDDCPLLAKEGGFIRAGFDAKLDELRNLAAGGKEWIARYQAQQIEETGITSLKVGFTSVFGYYIEVTNTHKDKVPTHYIRKQTLKNAERYITPELKEYAEKVLSADESSKLWEYELFLRLREEVFQYMAILQQTAASLAELDVLAGLGELAVRKGYVKPIIVDEPILDILEGRHPVLDARMQQGEFVPNDTTVGGEQGTIHLITGPNMAGKSTYIRQVALLTLMAQMGSFVPARKATIGLVDKIFARVGASDELARGQSTFMVEMVETARILNTATERSLVILDEIGRGTSTYDGLSLAWAIVEFIHDRVGARTLFATHYHELIELEKSLSQLRNLNVSVKEWDENVIFLHRIIPGGADRSYGIHVARLAGIPRDVNERAKDILAQLEVNHLNKYGENKISPPPRKKDSPIQLTLFEWNENPLIEKIRNVDVSRLTPLEALQLIEAWQRQLGSN